MGNGYSPLHRSDYSEALDSRPQACQAEAMQHRLVGRTAELRRLRHALGRGSLQGAVIAGPAGVGKTRLMREWLASLSKHRCAVRVSGTAAAARIPFGAFAQLLPEHFDAETSPLEVLRAASTAITERDPDGRGLVVAVDDAHLLDDGSATLVHQLVELEQVFVALTVRTGEPAPDPIVTVGKDDRTEWVELAELTPASTKALVEQVLGGPIETVTMRQLWERTGGNPLFVTELVRGGLEAGSLVLEGGAWRAHDRLTVPTRLHEVLAGRIRGLPEQSRSVLSLLAAAESFELRLLADLAGRHALESLEDLGLVSVVQDRRRHFVAVAHPLYAEVARAETPPIAAQGVSADLARAIKKPGLRRRDDLLRWAAWQLEAGEPAEPADLVEAARRAKAALDPQLAERCAEAALVGGGGFEARLLHAEAIAAQGRTDDAHGHFEQLAREAGDDQTRAQVALAHATSLLFHAGNKRAIEVLDAASEAVSDAAWRDELEAMLVFAAAYLGELPRAIDEGGRLMSRLAEGTAAVIRAAVIHTYALVLMGRYETSANLIDQGLQTTEQAGAAFPIGEHLLQLNRVVGLETSGRIREAEQLVRTQYQRAIASDTVDLRGLLANNLGLALCFRGDLEGFVLHLDEALDALRERDPVGVLPMALSFAALAHAMNGGLKSARQLLAEYDAHIAGRTPAFGENWRHRVDAWLHPEGLGEEAARLALHAGEIARREHQIAFGALALHDAVRFGHPHFVMEPLEEFASVAEGTLIPAFAEHARVLHERDTARLEDLSRRFEQMGADLHAAEAAAQASHLHSRAGAHDRARATRALALKLAGNGTRCRTLWRWIEPPGSLTPRELEVARLAATGMPDRDIADKLIISPRTVGNHLTAAYAKLGVEGRTELRPLITGEAD